MAAYNDAVAERRAPKSDTLRSLAILYKQSPEFDGLGVTTKREWTRWLDIIMDEGGPLAIGGLPFDALDDRRVKAEILAWRDQWADRPRKADYGIQVLSRVLSWGMDRGLLALNAAAGIKQLYTSNRADQIWTADEIARYAAAAKSPEVGFIVRGRLHRPPCLPNRPAPRRSGLALLVAHRRPRNRQDDEEEPGEEDGRYSAAGRHEGTA